MSETAFIVRQLRDLTRRAIFQPLTIVLIDGTIINVGDRQDVTFLSEGAMVTESGGTERVFAYSMICSLSTIFQLPLESSTQED